MANNTTRVSGSAVRQATKLPAKKRAEPLKSPSRRPRLAVVEAKKSRRIFIFKVAIISIAAVAAIFSVVIAEGVIAQRQMEIDSLSSQIANEQIVHQQLSAQVANLEAPNRIENYAQNKLNMVSPTNIIYVNPANPASSPIQSPTSTQSQTNSKNLTAPKSQTAPKTTKTTG
jgi:cell division protein FtsL